MQIKWLPRQKKIKLVMTKSLNFLDSRNLQLEVRAVVFLHKLDKDYPPTLRHQLISHWCNKIYVLCSLYHYKIVTITFYCTFSQFQNSTTHHNLFILVKLPRFADTHTNKSTEKKSKYLNTLSYQSKYIILQLLVLY